MTRFAAVLALATTVSVARADDDDAANARATAESDATVAANSGAAATADSDATVTANSDATVTASSDATSSASDATSAADAIVDEEVIVVTGTRSESPRQASPVTTEVIDRHRLVESGVQTVADALALRPGLWIERSVSGTSGVTMQGLGPQYSLVLVDGARQVGRTNGVLDLDRFGVEDLEQIEIVRGPSSVLYGSDALGGVVNLVTRTPRKGLAIDALARVDGRLGYEARARVAGGSGNYAGAVTGSFREAPAIRLDPASIGTSFAAYEDANVTARGVHRRGDAWRVNASADYLRRDMESVDATATGAVLDRRNLVETVATQVGARWSGERTTVLIDADASIYRDQFISDQRMADALDQYQLTDENLIEARAQIARQAGAHGLLAGAEVMREALESDRLSEPGDRVRAALFAQDQWRLGSSDQMIVVPAARLDADTQFGIHATPRIAGRWQPHEAVVARGSVGMGYRAPSFKEMLLLFQNPGAGYVVEGNPDLDPETSVSVQGGAEWQAMSWLWLTTDAYVNRLRDMIFAVSRADDGSGTLRFTYDNIGRARTAGFETYAIAVHGRAGIELGYALARTRDLDADRPLEGIPAHRFTATLRWRDKVQRFDAFASAVLTGHRPFFVSEDPMRATLTDRRIELRARIAKRFSSGLGGFMGIDNALDAGDAEIDPIPPRTIYAGVEAHY